MATIYEAPPPAYHEVVGKVAAQLKNSSSAEAMKSIVENLHPNDIKLLASHEPPPPKLSPEEEEKFRKGYTDAFNSEAAQRHMKLTAEEVAKACQAIATSFDTLGAKLATIDATAGTEEKDKFAPKFADLRKRYSDILNESREHAVSIAAYGERFDQIILPYIMDKELSKERKIEKIEGFIKDSQKFGGWALKTKQDFEQLKIDLESFNGTFSAWSVKKEGDLAKEVEQLTTDIDGLTKEIEGLQKKLLIAGSVAAGSLPVFGVAAILSGPFAPFVILAGVISASVAAGFAISYAAQISDRKERKDAKEAKRKEVKKTIGEIQKARTELTELGTQTLKTYGENIDVLNLVWNYVVMDAKAIETWLKGAENEAGDPPKYMLISMGNAKGLYAQMSVYLRRYADGVKAA